jgi:CubicO group peptidase (beta-lactamase class C family)
MTLNPKTILLLLIANGAPAFAQAPNGWPELARLFQTYVDSDRVVGASLLVLRDGRVLARQNAGQADRSANTPVTDETIFHWGSITKTLTAISIMQLRDHGKLSLDDAVVRYVPELRQVHDPFGMIDSITIRMLMSHTAGFQNPTWPYDTGKPWEPFEPTTWNQLVAMMPYQQLHFRPGSRYSYSNPAFIYLARIIEQVSGDPWDSYVQKNIFSPLGLDQSYFRTTPYYLATRRSHNYYIRKDSTAVERLVDNGSDFDPGITTPNGGWNAPLSDLVKYVAFLTGAAATSPAVTSRYDVVLKRSTLEEMWRPGQPMSQSYESAPNQWMGLSFFVLDRDGTRLLGHTGSQAGFRAFVYFNPVNRAAVIAAFNSTNSSSPANAAYRRLHEAALAILR